MWLIMVEILASARILNRDSCIFPSVTATISIVEWVTVRPMDTAAVGADLQTPRAVAMPGRIGAMYASSFFYITAVKDRPPLLDFPLSIISNIIHLTFTSSHLLSYIFDSLLS